MTTTSRPDLLPLALPAAIGLPLHGLVKGGDPDDGLVPGTLILPNAATMSYRQPADGGTILVQHPAHAALARTTQEAAHDAAQGYQWREYELLCGRRHQIGNHELGEGVHLYCDSEHTWRVRITVTDEVGYFTVTVSLVGLFGVFSDRDYSMTERQLATASVTPINRFGVTPTAWGSVSFGKYALTTYSKTGAVAVLNVGTDYVSSFNDSGVQFLRTQHGPDQYCHTVVRVAVSGTGGVVPGAIGNGITATIEVVATCVDFLERSGSGALDRLETHRLLYVVAPGGSETHYEWVWEETGSISYGDPPITATVEAEYADQRSFGGVTITSSGSYSGTWDRDAMPEAEGEGEVNGGTFAWDSGATEADAAQFWQPGALSAVALLLPLVVYIGRESGDPDLGQYLDHKLVFADGESATDGTNGALVDQYVTHNPATNDVASDDEPICYV